MNTHFVYERILQVEGKPDATVFDSFAINKIIRTIHMDDGRRLVLLDDIHERAVETPDINPKTNKVVGTRRERNTFQSEIYLNEEDGNRLLTIIRV